MSETYQIPVENLKVEYCDGTHRLTGIAPVLLVFTTLGHFYPNPTRAETLLLRRVKVFYIVYIRIIRNYNMTHKKGCFPERVEYE